MHLGFRGARRPPLRQAGRPPLRMGGSWRATCSKSNCSRAMNRGFQGARRPLLPQAGRPPLRMGGSWRGVERAALIPDFSRREKEKMLREVCRVEAGVRWNELRGLGRTGHRHVPEGRTRLPLPPGEGRGEGARFNPRRGLRGKVHGEARFPKLDTYWGHEPGRRRGDYD